MHLMSKAQVQGVVRGAVQERVKFIEQVFRTSGATGMG